MRYVVPHYYHQFRCVAGDCPDTCCAGWQIVIDQRTKKKYRDRKDAFGNRLFNSIDWRESSFKQYDGRCAFLNEENLCDIYLEAGPDMLCKTCRSYPRHVEEYEGSREISLSLSCPEAARLILGCREPVRFLYHRKVRPMIQKRSAWIALRRMGIMSLKRPAAGGESCKQDSLSREREGEEEYEDFDFFLYTKLEDARDVMLELLQNRKLPIKTRIGAALALGHDLQRRIDRQELSAVDGLLERYKGENAMDRMKEKLLAYEVDEKERLALMRKLFCLFGELEVLKPEWPAYIEKAREAALGGDGAERRRSFAARSGGLRELWLEQLMVYFVFTYFCGAVYDGRAYEKVKLAAVSTLLIEELAAAETAEQETEEVMIRTASHYSREVEHSDVNLSRLEHMFRTWECCGLENLLRLVMS